MVLSVWNLRESDKNEVNVDYNYLDLDNGLRALGSDQDVHDLSRYVLSGHKLINVYIEHGQTRLEWNENVVGHNSVNVVGESSVANEMGKNNVPSQFVDDFYSALDNENFNAFYDLDDAEEDSDYIADKLNDIDDVEVDMEDFHANVDVNPEFMGSGNLGRHVVFDDHVDVDVEVLDNDDFDSGLE
ncbi:hypothetical protein Tco_0469138 [Tanacetum coccineum]